MKSAKNYFFKQRMIQFLPTLSILLFTLLGLGESLGLRSIETPVVVIFSFLCLSIFTATVEVFENLLKVSKSNPFYSITFALLFLAIVLKGFMPAFARLIKGGANKVWDLDNLFFVSNARSIFVYGDASGNLGIAGEPLSYHTGPSFLLASLHSLLGFDFLGTIYWLDGVFVLALVLIGLQLIDLVAVNPVPYRLAFLVALNLPWARTSEDARIFLNFIFTRPSITFDTMFSTILGMYLLACFWTSLAKGRPIFQIISAVCTSVALLEVKPQYFPSLLLIILITYRITPKEPRYPFHYFLINVSLVSLIFLLSSAIDSENQIEIEYGYSLNGITLNFFKKFALSMVIVQLFVVLVLLLFKSLNYDGADSKVQLLQDIKHVLLLVLLVVGSTLAVEVIEIDVQVTKWISQESQVSMTRNDQQSLLPIYFLSLVISIGAILSMVQLSRMTLLGVALAAFSTSAYFQFLSIEYPNKTEDYADLRYARAAVSHLPSGGKVITNDFYFPNENYRRSFFGYLNTFTNAQFYFSMPNNFGVASSWSSKYESTMLFFGSEYSLSHFRFLDRNNIDSIVFTRRCDSPLIRTLPSYFKRVYSNRLFHVYTLYGLDNSAKNQTIPEATKYYGQETLFGESKCQPPEDWQMPSDSSYLLHTR